MTQILLISLGGAIGAILRYSIGKFTSTILGDTDVFTGTLFSNVIGCFFAGIILAWMGDNSGISEEVILFVTIGILGSITTFSTFALESYQLLDNGKFTKLISYLFIQVVIAFLLTAAGYALYQFTGGV
tara:strand:+ start:17212 stop:17598 length:387 start_codon:yes stop_codon:yes gene_type:complete